MSERTKMLLEDEMKFNKKNNFSVVAIILILCFYIFPSLAQELKENKKLDAKVKSLSNYKTSLDNSGAGLSISHKKTEKDQILFNGKTLDGWKVTNFDGHGKVFVADSSIILKKGETCTGIKWLKKFPTLNYEVLLEAKRVEGRDFFCGMTFPVKKEHCTLIVGGWGGTVVGLSSIDGLDASENLTGTFKKFNTDQWYSIRLQVTEKFIQVWIDGDKIIDFEIANSNLSLRWEVEPSKPFGIVTWKTTAAIRNLKLIVD